jgi:hypothetical protein
MVTGATNSWLFMNLFMISFTADLSSAKLKWLSRNPIINPTGIGNTFDFSFKCPEMINDSKSRFSVSVQRKHTDQLVIALYIMWTAWFKYMGIKPHFMEAKFKVRRFVQNSYSFLMHTPTFLHSCTLVRWNRHSSYTPKKSDWLAWPHLAWKLPSKLFYRRKGRKKVKGTSRRRKRR